MKSSEEKSARTTAIIAAAAMVISINPALAYDRRDATYVTSSKSRTVLDYIVCLEGVVSNTPKKMSIATSLETAEKTCREKAKKLVASPSEPNAEDIRAMILECGFRPGDGSPDAGCGMRQEASAERTPPQAPSASAGKYRLSGTEQLAVQTGVRRALKDPVSAIFGGMAAARDKEGFVYVCGSVNAKNSFGGYIGHQPYFGMLVGNGPRVGFAVAGLGGVKTESEAILKVCRDRGII
ncbi:hypothetical protein [Rhizobium sp. IBUN]|uniref:hypothetical protein n=1 Tax=Rhizobium sp. IBUN TaxID=1042326 RepID=UPI0004715BB3|nr:hypothetical protein [Rhizobium sp. IBUN]